MLTHFSNFSRLYVIFAAFTLCSAAGPPASNPTDEKNVKEKADQDSLPSAKSWLDHAELDAQKIVSLRRRHSVLVELARTRAEIGDVDGAIRILNQSLKGSPEVPSLQLLVARQSIRQLAASGKLKEAANVATQTGSSSGVNQQVWAELTVAQARAGDIESATQTMLTLDKEMSGRAGAAAVDALIVEGKIVLARQLADQIHDDFWKQLSVEHIAVAKATTGDIDGAIADVTPLTAQSVRTSASSEVAAAASAKRNDDGAMKIVPSLSADERQIALRYVAQAQLARGDVSTAIQTARQLDGNERAIFHRILVQELARLNKTDQAIDVALRDKNPELVGEAYNAMLKYDRLEGAQKLIALLPEPRFSDLLDTVTYKIYLRRRLAAALADDDNLKEARQMMAEAEAIAAAHGSNRIDPSIQQATFAIAAAELRKGDQIEYDRSRKRFVDALTAAKEEPQQQQAWEALMAFDIGTHNLSAVEKSWNDPKFGQPVKYAYGIAFHMIDPSRPEKPPEDLKFDRGLLCLVFQNSERVRVDSVVNQVALWHVKQSKLNDWLTWTQKLPTPELRARACIGAALAVHPASDIQY